jgi:hypothetical protein
MIMPFPPEEHDGLGRERRGGPGDLDAWWRQRGSAPEWILPTHLEVEPGTWVRTPDCSADSLLVASDARSVEARRLIGASEELRRALRLLWQADELRALAAERGVVAEGEPADA